MKRIPILTVGLLAAVIAGTSGLLHWHSPLAADDAEPSGVSSSASSTADPELDNEEPQQSNAATLLLRQSRNRLFDRKSVSAKLHETVSMGDRKFRASGAYFAGAFPKLRLEFEVEVGKTKGTLLEVCDGTILWTEQSLQSAGGKEPTVQVSRTVIEDVLDAVAQSDDNPEAMLIAGLGVGGVPALLAALERAMIFEALKTDEAGGRPFSVIQGRWNDDYQARFGGTGGKPLPDYVPDRVRIYIDQETLFPTRILYLKQVSAQQASTADKKYHALLSLEFSEIVLDGPVSEENFRYQPSTGIETRDRTKEFLDLIQQANQRAETAETAP